MPTIPVNLSDFGPVFTIVKAAVLIILVFYAVFALLIVRQVDLMSQTLITKVSGLLKAFSIIHAGFAIGLIILAYGLLNKNYMSEANIVLTYGLL